MGFSHILFYSYELEDQKCPEKQDKKNKRGAKKKIKILKIIQFLISLLYFLHFSFVRGGASITELSLRSKFSIGLFLVSVNIFSAQLWSETCKKFSPISYKECTLVREQDLHQPDYDYLPDILKAWIWLYVNAKK